MLYDECGLVLAYLEAWQVTGNEDYANTVKEVLTYLNRDMVNDDGAFYSAEDADSEGVEGKFYLWTVNEIEELLGDKARDFCSAYQVASAGNYHDEMTGQLTGSNILHRTEEPQAPYGTYSSSRNVLFAAREKRVRPHLDDKVLTAWNGMAITAFAQAGRVLNEKHYTESARRAAVFVLSKMRYEDGRLLRRSRHGEAAITAFSEDYAFFARGLLDLYTSTLDAEVLSQAIQVAGYLKDLFQDAETGKLYDTPSDGEPLLIRPSTTYDGAMPSASSISAEVFVRLFLLTGDVSWRNSAETLLNSLATEVSRYPAGFTQSLQSASWLLQPTREIVIVGARNDPATDLMLSIVRSANLERTVVLLKTVENCDRITSLAPYADKMTSRDNKATAYICHDFSCLEPVTDAATLKDLLSFLPGVKKNS
jgi:uncharacterized protein YyaL (SSP411 family)